MVKVYGKRVSIELEICSCQMIIIVNLKTGFYRCWTRCSTIRRPITSYGHHRKLSKGLSAIRDFGLTCVGNQTNYTRFGISVSCRLGQRINDESSIYYWAAKNKIPVFSPALTDGSLGDMMYFHSHRNPGLVVDILSDLKRLNTMAVKALNSGVIIVGGGLIKHHICNANLMVSCSNAELSALISIFFVIDNFGFHCSREMVLTSPSS